MDRLKALLERGYFPAELPPPFNTKDLAKHRAYVDTQWSTLGDPPRTSYATYSFPRVRKLRRVLAITNPISQFYLCKLIAHNWPELSKHIRRSKCALAVLKISAQEDRAVSPPDFGLVALRRSEISARFDHTLVSDFSRFYGTLYTHAIAWALHGKIWCKNNLHSVTFKSSLGNRLDIAVRKGQDNQTIGIPVGPDTSRIISEVVAVAIDIKVQEALNLNQSRALRHVDDWYIGFDGAGEAEDAISAVAVASREFEIELNTEKTKTLNLVTTVEAVWPNEIRRFYFPPGKSPQQRALEHFFTIVFHHAAANPEENVIDFALKRTRGVSISRENWRLYETFLLKAARSNGTVLPGCIQVLVNYNFRGFPLDKDRISKLINDLIREHAPLGNTAEVSWALFLAKGLKLKIDKSAANLVSSLENPVCALLALDLKKRKLIGQLDTRLWRRSMNADGLKSGMWLLAYEADIKGWLIGTPPDFVDVHPFFSVLKSKKVSFYDEKKNVSGLTKRVPKKPSSSVASFRQSANLPMSSIVGFEY